MSYSLNYTDDADRALGVAGSVIAITVREDTECLDGVDMDASPGESLSMSASFHFTGNPRMSARVAWRHMVQSLELSSAILVANVMCRSYVGRGERLSSRANSTLKALVRDEGHNVCGLDDDEIDAIYNRLLRDLDHVFCHPTVHHLARGLADALQRRRSLSTPEIIEILQALQR